MKADHKPGKHQVFTSVPGSSIRPSNRPDFQSSQRAPTGAEAPAKGNDSPPFQGDATRIPADRPVRTKTTKLTRKQLERIEEHLSARDHAVLQAIRKYRFLTTDQIGRLYITNCSTKTSQTRQQNLLVRRLCDHGLIRSLERRIGGYGGGSSMQIWYLTEAGYRILILNDPGEHPRKRFVEPSTTFLAHTLAIAECAVQLTCLCRGSTDLTLDRIDTEPPCWRAFYDQGKVNYLKPDLFAITGYDHYEDRWFIEIDLDTESQAQVIDKCDTYLRYYHTGIEQKETGMFPLVVWLVPSASRKERVREYIKNSIQAQQKLFLVITPDELEPMLRQYIDVAELC